MSEPQGRYALGLNPRPFDPREAKYRLAAVPDLDWRSVRLDRVHSLVVEQPTGLWDPRPPVGWQGKKGACAAASACEAAEELSWQAGRGQPVALSTADLYERVRRAENGANWQADSGSTLAGNLDLAMTGLCAAADAPESDDLSEDYDALTAGKPTYDYVLGHLPAWPNEDPSDPDYLIKVICAALDSRRSVILGSYWPQPWFAPDADGLLPPVAQYLTAGGHAYRAWAWLPILGGVFACQNHWNPPGGAAWNPQVAASGYHLRPGDFLLPAWALRGKQPAVFEVRAVTWEPVVPQPTPQPAPQPTGCRDSATTIAQRVVAGFTAAHAAKPRETTALHESWGAGAVRDALQKELS